MLLQWPCPFPIRLAQFREAAEGLGLKTSLSTPLHSPEKFGKALQDFHHDHGQPESPSNWAKFHSQSFTRTWAISIGPTALVLYVLTMSSASTVSSEALGV